MKFANLLNIPPGLVLIAAALLKGYQLVVSPVGFGEFWSSASVGITVLVGEFVIGSLLLLPIVLGKWTKHIGLTVFGLFFVYTLWAKLSGKTSCGCLGLVEIPLPVMSLIDLGMLVSLSAWIIPQSALDYSSPRKWVIVAGLLLISGFAGLFLAMYESNVDVKYVQAPETHEDDFIADSDFVFIKPDEWLGKRFPLARYVNCDEVFLGTWSVVFYNEGCSKCKSVFEKIYANKGKQRFLLVKVVSTSQNTNNDSEYIKWRSLPNTNEWFVESPKIVEVSEGVVQSVKSQL